MAEVINQLVEAMNAHDLDAVVQLFHRGYQSEQSARPAREFGSSAQVRVNWDAMFEGIPNFRAELVRSADDGRTCWTEWHWWGTRTDSQPFDMRGVAIFELQDGLIVGGRLYMEPVEHGSNIEQAVEMQSGVRPAD
jgi:limonene-1,2-epoxide hydrolase